MSRVEKINPRTCDQCGIRFQPPTKKTLYCSESCYFAAKHKVCENGCWEWLGALDPNGYGEAAFNRRIEGSHRFSWRIHNGQEVPEGLDILHSCDNPPCVNPAHLHPGIHAENMAEMVDRERQARGETSGNHVLTEEEVIAIYLSTKSNRALAREYDVCRSHISRIRSDFFWSHLTKDIVKPQRGNPGASTLDAKAVAEIYVSDERHSVLAIQYGVHPNQIGRIKDGKQWKEITENLVKGTKNGRQKLSDDDKVTIYHSGEGMKELASRYEVGLEHIRKIKRDARWSEMLNNESGLNTWTRLSLTVRSRRASLTIQKGESLMKKFVTAILISGMLLSSSAGAMAGALEDGYKAGKDWNDLIHAFQNVPHYDESGRPGHAIEVGSNAAEKLNISACLDTKFSQAWRDTCKIAYKVTLERRGRTSPDDAPPNEFTKGFNSGMGFH